MLIALSNPKSMGGLSKWCMPILALIAATSASQLRTRENSLDTPVLKVGDQLLHLNGRWDESPGTWWTGSGFKFVAEDLSSMVLNLGPHTTQPEVAIGLSVNYGPFVNINVTEGANVLPLNLTSLGEKGSRTVVRLNAQGWQNNRLNVESIVLNLEAKLQSYAPSKLAFQFIGDSLSAGQYLPNGVDGAWPFLTGETFKAEHNVQAQPGACLTDIPSYGNVHGVSYEFFRTEDTGYYYTTDHNFVEYIYTCYISGLIAVWPFDKTTPWNFKRDIPGPTHVIIHIGANDASENVTGEAFVDTYLAFTNRLRTLYPSQPIFVFTPWGWPNPDGTISQYYEGRYEELVTKRHLQGDKQVFLVNTTGWVTYADVFPANQHPNPEGHMKIARLFGAWLENWGLHPEASWPTLSN